VPAFGSARGVHKFSSAAQIGDLQQDRIHAEGFQNSDHARESFVFQAGREF